MRARRRPARGGCFCGARRRAPALAARAGDLLRINFNISFPHLACQYASVDLSDVLGMVRLPRAAAAPLQLPRPSAPHRCMPRAPRRQVRYNVTKTVRKRPIDEAGTVLGEWYIDPRDSKHEARALLFMDDMPALRGVRGRACAQRGRRRGGSRAASEVSRRVCRFAGGGLAAAGAASGG